MDLRISENGASHHTENFDIMRDGKGSLVIRRGQDFYLDLVFNRAFRQDKDGVSFVFTVAGKKILAVVNHTVF